MMSYKKVTREQIASYLNTTPESTETWSIIGVGITDYGQSFNPQVTTEKWIINKNATSSLDSYQIQGDVSQKCYFGDPVYDFVNNLRRTAGVGDKVNTQILDIDLYDSTGENTAIKYKATKYDCMVAVTSYATGETPVIEYSIYYNGDPIVGTVTIADSKPTFTPDAG
jgi:hypothetical protein